jgi:hypothetical protein
MSAMDIVDVELQCAWRSASGMVGRHVCMKHACEHAPVRKLLRLPRSG